MKVTKINKKFFFSMNTKVPLPSITLPEFQHNCAWYVVANIAYNTHTTSYTHEFMYIVFTKALRLYTVEYCCSQAPSM